MTVISAQQLMVSENPRVDAALAKVTKPLDRLEIDTIKVEAPAIEERVHLRDEDAGSFEQDPPKTGLEVVCDDVTVQFVTAQLRAKGKWRVDDGDKEFTATLEDEGFAESIAEGKRSPNAKDLIKVRLRTEPYLTKGGHLRKRYAIEKVYDIL